MGFLARIFGRFLPKKKIAGFSYRDLPKILSVLEKTLIADIPNGVKGIGVDGPIYCMMLMYFDSCFTEFTPQIWLVPESTRPKMIEKHKAAIRDAQERIAKPKSADDAKLYRNVLDACLKHDTVGGHYVYSPAEVQSVKEYHPTDIKLRNGCYVCYQLMLSTNTTGLPLEDESEMFKPFRDMMCRVARQMNSMKWHGIMPTTDDFVAFAVDAHENGADEDFRDSVPYELRKLLRSRKLIPQDWLSDPSSARN